MDDSEISDLLQRARRAQERVDTSRPELFFETRMQSVLKTVRRPHGGAGRFQAWIRASAILAAATGLLAFFSLSSWEEIDTEDTLYAWWTDNSAALNLQLFSESKP
jgi:hypothetical protein